LFCLRVRLLLDKLIAKAKREDGQGLVEYGLILALVAVGAVIALKAMGTSVNTALGSIKEAITPTTP
jgi:pilus assembly protein Flp/PilA